MTARTYYPRCRVLLDLVLEDWAGGADESLQIIEAVPLEAEVQRNHHRAADTARIELDYASFPLDPRTLRAVRAIVLMGTVTEPGDELSADTAAHRAFLGFVDEPATSLADDGDTVVLEARDATSLFLDFKWAAGTAIDITQTLAALVSMILDTVPGVASMLVDFSEGAGDVVLADLVGRTKWAISPGDDAWTILVELCGLAGLIPVVEMDTLRIASAAEFKETEARFVYGENVSRLSYRRKLVESRSAQIVVRCWDEQARETREAVYPPAPLSNRTKLGVDGQPATTSADDKKVPYYMSGAYSVADLQAIAEAIYEEGARRQIEGELETYDLRDLEDETDLWLLGNGAQLSVELGRGEWADISGMGHGEAVAYLEARGWAADVADAYAKTRELAEGVAVSFYVRTARHRWSRADGYKSTIDFINYV